MVLWAEHVLCRLSPLPHLSQHHVLTARGCNLDLSLATHKLLLLLLLLTALSYLHSRM
jgi:hypothetical protein